MALFFDQEDTLQLVGFRIGPRLFGANILTVREILRNPAIESTQDLPDFLAGVHRLKGEVLPMIDLGRILGLSHKSTRECVWALVAKAGEKDAGYIVDTVTPIVRVKKDAVFSAPDIIMEGVRSKYINGVCETEKGLLVVARLSKVLLDDEIRTINKLTIG